MTAVVPMTRHYFWSLDESKIEASFGLFDSGGGAQACVERHGKIGVWKWTSLSSKPSDFRSSTSLAYLWDVDSFYSPEKSLCQCIEIYVAVIWVFIRVVEFTMCMKMRIASERSFYFLSLSAEEMSTAPLCWTSRDIIWRPGLWNWYELLTICPIIAKVW